MRIAQLAPLWERVPPPAYGGIEMVVYHLTEELTRLGHQVTLFASGDSCTSAELRSVFPRSLRTADDLQHKLPYDWLHHAVALRAADEFDIIHNHAGELPMAMSLLIRRPMLSTLHGLVIPDTRLVWDYYPWYYNTLSHAARRAMPPVKCPNYLGVVYNGIDVAAFPFSPVKSDYLLFLSRIAPEKGTHLAIEIARRIGCRLIIAGKVDPVDREYYTTVIKPRIDGALVEYVGEATREQAKDLLRQARCLLLPLCWEEPFGLVMVEAMACGTPVVAMRRGAAPELVIEGVTGFLGDSVDDLCRAIPQVETLDPVRCRQHVAENFSVQRMVQGYLRLYEQILAAHPRSPAPAITAARPADGQPAPTVAGRAGPSRTHP